VIQSPSFDSLGDGSATLENTSQAAMATTSNLDAAIEVRELERHFGSFVAVNRISFSVARGEIFGFLGPNGAGKSTTIRMLCGILAPTGGQGSVAGFDLRTQSEQIKAHIGYMSQKFSLYDDLTVEENIDFYSGLYGLSEERKRERKQWVLEMAGIAERRKQRTAYLAGGWKQRLALGCALLHSPDVLFLDEPTSGVDPPSRRRFWDLIYQLSSEGMTIFVTTHYLDEAEHCNRLGLIYAGELIALGTPDELREGASAPAGESAGQSVGQSEIVEILSERAPDALEALEGVPEVRAATLYGQGLHVRVAVAVAAIPAIEARLRAADISFTHIAQIRPSMEDVFLSRIAAYEARRAQRTGGATKP
jgi:ABC-2 type transport system ATP-binding protein